jgi:Spy/CpxP family protein refolding chaperone
MDRIRLVAIGAVWIFALTAVAQQAAKSSDAHDERNSSMPPVEKHLKMLTEKLDLTGEQQPKIKPILQEMQDCSQKFMQDESMSPDERRDNVKACRYRADKEVRKILSNEQKKRLDQLEEEPHS